MKIFTLIFVFIVLISLISCFKSDICECTTYDSIGEPLIVVSRGDGGGDCNSQETVITDSGDTNTIICQMVRR